MSPSDFTAWALNFADFIYLRVIFYWLYKRLMAFAFADWHGVRMFENSPRYLYAYVKSYVALLAALRGQIWCLYGYIFAEAFYLLSRFRTV